MQHTKTKSWHTTVEQGTDQKLETSASPLVGQKLAAIASELTDRELDAIAGGGGVKPSRPGRTGGKRG